MAVGDVMLGDSSHFLGRGVGTAIKSHKNDFLFTHIRDLLSKSDIFIFNLESPISSIEGGNFRSRLYRGFVNPCSSLNLGTINIASLANNHIMQHGPSVLYETRNNLEKEGIACVGHSPNGGHELRTIQKKIRDFTICIHSESFIHDRSGLDFDCADIEERITKSISEFPADIRIVSLHWGDEYVPLPSPQQQQLAHRLVDRGANLILGHHPHVLQPVEEYKGALIAYSLGNFIFDQRWGPEVETGVILDVELSPTILNWKFHLTRINHNYQPELLTQSKSDFQRFNERLIQIIPDLSISQYELLKSKFSRRFRFQMKWELLRHFWNVSFDTWSYLLSNNWWKLKRQLHSNFFMLRKS